MTHAIQTLYHPFSRDQFSFAITEDDIIYIFGGIQGKKLSDLWSFDLNDKNETLKWEHMKEDDNFPIPRYGQSMIYYDSHLYIFGGCTKDNYWRGREENICIYDITYNQFSYPICAN